ncbi:MAG: diguanylate cyclase (GGDEF)-like protein [Oleispira sp.]|jgi:diguanylate cyclase (GGDEF)-like protein
MLKQFGFLLFFLSFSFTGFTSPITYNEQEPNYLGMAQYISHDEALSLNEVRQLNNAAWNEINIKEASFGFNQRHFWFRLPLQNIYSSDTPWLLRSNYPLLDHIDVYLLADNELVQEFHSGDTFPFNQRPIKQPTFVFPLKINTDKEYFIYLHIQTTSSLQLALSLQTERYFWQTVAIENVTSAAFYAILLSMLFYNAVIFFIVRARSYLFYIFYIASFTLLMASIHGWGYQFLWPNSPKIHELSVVLAIGPVIIFGVLFTSTFLKLATLRPRLNRLVLSLVWISCVYCFAVLILTYAIMIRVGSALAIVAAGIIIFATLREWFRSRSREVMLFIIAWITLLIGFSLYSGQKFGLLPINTLTEHAIEIGAVLEVLLLALGLADRINSERKARIETQTQMLDIQIKANQELDNKVRERTEELENLNDHLQTTSITDSLTQIKNRHYFDNKFSTEYRRAFRDKSWVALLVIDIDHFKLFNDHYGHQAGDIVLQAVAKSMVDVVQRPSDAVSRFGGEEFTVLLPNTPKEGAYKVAERIRKHIAELHVNWQQQSLSVTVSIGLASCIPSHYDGEALLLKQADDFLYVAKDHGRNQVVYEDNNPTATQYQTIK